MKTHFVHRMIAIISFIIALNPAIGCAQITDANAFAEGGNEFALELYGQLRQQPGNLFFSPFGVRAALAMVYAGADGETAAQMARSLHFQSSGTSLHEAASMYLNRLNTGDHKTYEFTVSNSIWSQGGMPLRKEFFDVIGRHYADAINRVDFRNAAEAARVAINTWVEEKTKQKVRELLSPRSIDASTRMLLVNTLYFKGSWVEQFPKTATGDTSFHPESGERVKAKMMRNTVTGLCYIQTKDYQAVELRYRGFDPSLSMLIVLPVKKNGLAQLEKKLSTKMLQECVAQSTYEIVDVFLPRFKITWGTNDIQNQLRVLGMPLAFSPGKADFSRINGRKPLEEDALFVSAVLHKAFVNVQEEGTEAVAATAVRMAASTGAIPKKPVIRVFRADHPFLFVIRDSESGTILFAGRVADPTK